MKILCSPTKTMRPANPGVETLMFPKETEEVLRAYGALSKEERGELLHIEGELLEKAETLLQDFGKGPGVMAVEGFSGLQFQYLDWESLDAKAREYLDEHLFILSAVYGLIPAATSIHGLRLDMKDRLEVSGVRLETFWRKVLEEWARNEEEPILLIASSEYANVFSKNIREKMVQVSFGERVMKEGEPRFRAKATYAKMARGSLLREMATREIASVEELKGLSILGMVYNEGLSEENHLRFTKEEE